MATLHKTVSGAEYVVLDDGTVRGLGLKPSDMRTVRATMTAYADALGLIPRDQWPKEGGGGLMPFMKYRWNQGQQGSCGGHGATAAFTAAWNYQGGTDHEFSPTYTYSLVNGGQDNGSIPEDLMKALSNHGTCLRSTVGPNEIYQSRYSAQQKQQAAAESARFRAGKQYLITSFDEMGTAMLRNHAVYTGIFIGGRFRPDGNGIVPAWDGSQSGGHCTAQIGKLVNINGVWYAGTLNSWFPWGVDGQAYLPESYFGNGHDRAGLANFAGVAIVDCLIDPAEPAFPTPQAA